MDTRCQEKPCWLAKPHKPGHHQCRRVQVDAVESLKRVNCFRNYGNFLSLKRVVYFKNKAWGSSSLNAREAFLTTTEHFWFKQLLLASRVRMFSRGAKKNFFNDFLFLIFLQILTNAQTLASTRATKTRRAWTNQEATRAPATKDIAETDSHAFVSNSQIPGASGASVFLRRSYWIVIPRNFVSLLGKDWTQRMRAFLGAITHGYLAKPRRDISVFIWSQLLRADFMSCHHWWSLFSKFKW